MKFPFPFRRRSMAHPTVPEGYRVFAIGDIHGCDDLLKEMLDIIDSDIAARGPAQNVVVFLGDLIDRGPASAEVIERLLRYARANVTPVFLAGNHEEVLLRILGGDDNLMEDWLRFGGKQCCQSYGIDVKRLSQLPPADAGAAVRRAIPSAHHEFLSGFQDTVCVGDYLFVHAGIRPGVSLANQAQYDLRWIREPFLSDERNHGMVVVHGHTISDGIRRTKNRIGIDTGAYSAGVLTAFCAEGEEVWFLEATGLERRPVSTTPKA